MHVTVSKYIINKIELLREVVVCKKQKISQICLDFFCFLRCPSDRYQIQNNWKKLNSEYQYIVAISTVSRYGLAVNDHKLTTLARELILHSVLTI